MYALRVRSRGLDMFLNCSGARIRTRCQHAVMARLARAKQTGRLDDTMSESRSVSVLQFAHHYVMSCHSMARHYRRTDESPHRTRVVSVNELHGISLERAFLSALTID